MKLQIYVTVLILFMLVSCSSDVQENSLSMMLARKNAIIEGERILDFALSPEGNKLAVYSNKGVYLYDLESMHTSLFLEFEDENYSSIYAGAIAFAPDGKHLAISGKQYNEALAIWDLSNKHKIQTIPDLPTNYFVSEVEFSPDGQSLLVRNQYESAKNCHGLVEDKMTLHRLPEGERLFEADKCTIYPPIKFYFSQDDRLFLDFQNMSSAYALQIVDTQTGQTISRELYNATQDGGFLGVSQEGALLLIEKSVNNRHGTYLTHSESGTVTAKIEGTIVLFQNQSSYVIYNRYLATDNPSSRWEYWQDGQLKCIYDGIEGEPHIEISVDRERFAHISPYNVGQDIFIQVWDVSTCKIIDRLKIGRYDD